MENNIRNDLQVLYCYLPFSSRPKKIMVLTGNKGRGKQDSLYISTLCDKRYYQTRLSSIKMSKS